MCKNLFLSDRSIKIVLFLGAVVLSITARSIAQGRLDDDLAGSSWETGVFATQPNTYDNSVMSLSFYYEFDKQGKVKAVNIMSKTAGTEIQTVREFVYPGGWQLVRKAMPTPPQYSRVNFAGTYKVEGNALFLDLPDYTVSATIYSGSIKGVLSYKKTDLKKTWEIKKVSVRASPSVAKSSYSNIDCDSDGNCRPAEGYLWVNPQVSNDLQVKKNTERLWDPTPELVKVGYLLSRREGGLRLKMKDNSIIRVDLGQAEEITVVSAKYDSTTDPDKIYDALSKGQGILRVKMKNGEIKRIDLSQKDEVTAENYDIRTRAKHPIN